MLSTATDMSSEEVTDEVIDRVLANHFPSVEFTEDDQPRYACYSAPFASYAARGRSHKEIMAMVDDEVLLEVLDPPLVD